MVRAMNTKVEERQGVKQAIVAVPEKTIGASFNDEPLSKFGFWADWEVKPKWNLCNSPGTDGGKVKSVGAFLESDDRILVCTHATFRFAVEKLGVEAFDNRLIAVDEFHHVSASEDNILGKQLNEFITRDRVHVVAMTGSYFRGDAAPILLPENESKLIPSPTCQRRSKNRPCGRANVGHLRVPESGTRNAEGGEYLKLCVWRSAHAVKTGHLLNRSG